MTQFQQGALTDVITGIFSAELRFCQREVDRMVDRNKELLGPGTAEGFIYMDKWYENFNSTGRANQSLHPSLYPPMILLVQHYKRISDDKQIITQVLHRLIKSCHTHQDVRNEMPECVVSTDLFWSQWTRTREPASSIQSDAVAMRRYSKVLTKIEAYCAMRFLV